MDLVELGVMPFLCFISAVLAPLLSLVFSKKAGDLVAISCSIICMALAARIFLITNAVGITMYKFGGFPPPLGVAYVADPVNSMLALLTSFALFISMLLALVTIDNSHRYLFYASAYLLVAGVYGCLFTNDIFNLYVSIELTAISSYVLTAFYRSRRAIRAALIYGLSGTVVTSFLLLVAFMVYGSYGTLNMVDIALKVLRPETITPFSGGVFGDIVLSSKVSLALVTWAFLFKSGIVPNHFWLPEAYLATPLPAMVLFTAGADIVGVYGLLRLYYTVFPGGEVLGGYRDLLLSILLAIGVASTVISSVLVSRQTTVRKLIAYSSISQFSLALLGIATKTVEGISGSILHIVANGLGDIAVICSVTALYYVNTTGMIGSLIRTLSKLALVVGLLNIFGIAPIFPGFWSKAFITLGFIKADAPWGAAVVLISAGLCAIGYLRMIMRVFALHKNIGTSTKLRPYDKVVAIVMLLLPLALILCIGLALLTLTEIQRTVLSYGHIPMDIPTYVSKVIPMR